MHRFLAAALASLLVLAAMPHAMAQGEVPRTSVISMLGNGVVSAPPDMARVTTGVVTQADTARAALNANTEAMSRLVEAIRAAGIEGRDIQTSGFSVQPLYVYSDRRDQSGYTPPPRINGYQVNNNLTVRVRQLDTLGQLLDRMVTVGSNTINGISFGVADDTDLMRQARRKAVVDARDKAELYADAAGVCLGRVLSITESGGYSPQPAMMRQVEMAADASVPVEAGELDFSISVNIEWALQTENCPAG